MKIYQTLLLAVALSAAYSARAAEPAAPVAKPDAQSTNNAAGAVQPAVQPGAPVTTQARAAATNDLSIAGPQGITTTTPAQNTEPAADAIVKTAGEEGSNTLHMNFRGASLDMVLNHLSEAA